MIDGAAGWRRLIRRSADTRPAEAAVLDGPLKPNRRLDEASVLATFDCAGDLATDGTHLYVADGARIVTLDPCPTASGRHPETVFRAEGPITALACLPGGGFAVAIEGRRIVSVNSAVRLDWSLAAERPFTSINALSVRASGALWASEGSARYPTAAWCHDLMSHGRTGRVLAGRLDDPAPREIARGLGFAFGVLQVDAGAWIAESWRHRVIGIDATGALSEVCTRLPGYPSRITPAAGGGAWLTVFAPRTQLVDFVLQEDAFRARMTSELDPAHWIAPALSSGHSYLEPMQAAQLKTMGVVKPWAPPRSYGLVVRLDGHGRVVESLHSRFDGEHHGIVSVVECAGHLFALSRGAGRVIQVESGASAPGLGE